MPEYLERVVTGPTLEPIKLSDIKTHLRVDIDDHDAYLNNLIVGSRNRIESITDRAIVYQTRAVYFKGWPSSDYIEIPSPPLIDVDSVKYTDIDGDSNTFADTNYSVDIYSDPGRVVLGYGKIWPDEVLHNIEFPIVVTFTCGYITADSPPDYRAAIPENIKQAIKLDVQSKYDQPVDRDANYIENAIQSLLAPYRVWRF